jgi:type II secretory pathway pseudopilin PulG
VRTPFEGYTKSERGFALAELVAVIAIVALTAVIAKVLSDGVRRRSMASVSVENLHRHAAATTSYAADSADLFWTTSWRAGMDLPTEWGDLKNKNHTDYAAGAAQVIDILRRVGGRLDINFIDGWIPQIYFSHVPLLDYLKQVPATWVVSPADRHRLAWANDPKGFDKGVFLPCQPSPGNATKRWPYSSSYQLSPSFYDQSDVDRRLAQASGIDTYNSSTYGKMHGFAMSGVVFPSQKVHLFEGAAHHTEEGAGPDCDEPRPFVFPDSRVAMVFVDGHAAWNVSADANPGWQPRKPESPDPTYITVDGEYYPGIYRWTRQGIAGRDFGGPEVGPP